MTAQELGIGINGLCPFIPKLRYLIEPIISTDLIYKEIHVISSYSVYQLEDLGCGKFRFQLMNKLNNYIKCYKYG